MDSISSQPVSISTPRSSRSRVSNFFSLKKSTSSKDLTVLYHGPVSPPPSLAEAWSPSHASVTRLGRSIDNPEYLAGERIGTSTSVERERERDRSKPQAGLGIAFPSPRLSPQFANSPVHRLAGLASTSNGLPTAYIHGGNSPLLSNETFLPASMTSPPITSPNREDSLATSQFGHHSPGLGYTYRGHHVGYSYPTSVPMSHSSSNDKHHSRHDPNQTTTTSASIRTHRSSESADRSAHTSMTSLRTYPSVSDLRSKQRTHNHSQSQPQPPSQSASQIQPQATHFKNVSFSSIKTQPVSKPPLLSPVAPSQASSASHPTSTPSFSDPNQLQVQQQQRQQYSADAALKEAQRKFLLLQQLHLDELTAHSVDASGWLEPGNGCEAVFAPRPRLRSSLDANPQIEAPRMHSKSMSDTGNAKMPRQYASKVIPSFERNRPLHFQTLRVRSASNPSPHSTFKEHAQDQKPPPVPQVPGRDASLRSSHARLNNGTFAYDADQDKPFFHHRMPPEPPKKSRSMGRASLGVRASQDNNCESKSTPVPELSIDTELASHVSSVLAEGEALNREREQWRREHQRSLESSIRRRSKSRERSKSRNSSNPLRAKDIWDADVQSSHQRPGSFLPIPVNQMNAQKVQIPEMRMNNGELTSEVPDRKIRTVKSSPQLGASAAAEQDWGTSSGRHSTPSPQVSRGLCVFPSWIQGRPSPASRTTSTINGSNFLFKRNRPKSHARSSSQNASDLGRKNSGRSVRICGSYLSRKKRSSQVVHPSPPGSPSPHQKIHIAAQRRHRSSGSWDVSVTGSHQNAKYMINARRSLGKGRESQLLDEPVMINRSSGVQISQAPTYKEQGTSPGVGISDHHFGFPSNQTEIQEELLRPVMEQGDPGSGSDRTERSRSVTPSESIVGIALASPSPAVNDGAFEASDAEKTPTQQRSQQIRAGRHPTSVDYQPRISSDLKTLARDQDSTRNVALRSQPVDLDPSIPLKDKSSFSRRKPLPLDKALPNPPLVVMNSQRPLRSQGDFELLPPLEIKRTSSSASGDFPKDPDSLPVPPRRQRSSNALAPRTSLSVSTERPSARLDLVPFQTPTLPVNEDHFSSSHLEQPEHKQDEDSPFHPRNISDNSALSVPTEEPRPDSEVIPNDGTPSPTEKRSPSDEGRSSDVEVPGPRSSQSRSKKHPGHSAASSISSATQAGSFAPRERWIVDDEGSNDGNRFDNLWFRNPHSSIHREEVSEESVSDELPSLRKRRDSDVVLHLVQSSLQGSSLTTTRINSAYDPALKLDDSSEGGHQSNDDPRDSWRMGRVDHQTGDRKRLQSHGSMAGEIGLITSDVSTSGNEHTTFVEEVETPYFHFAAPPLTDNSSTSAREVAAASSIRHRPKTSVSTNASFIDMEDEGGDTSGETTTERVGQEQPVKFELLSSGPAPQSRSSAADYLQDNNEDSRAQSRVLQYPSALCSQSPWPDLPSESDNPRSI